MSPSISRKGSWTRDSSAPTACARPSVLSCSMKWMRTPYCEPSPNSAGDLVAEMTDDDVDLGDAAVAHHLDLVGEQRPIQDRQDRLRAALRERIHPRALAGGEDDADHAAVEISHAALPSTLQRTSSRMTRTASNARIFLPSSNVRPRKLTGTSAKRAPRCASRAVNSASKSKPLALDVQALDERRAIHLVAGHQVRDLRAVEQRAPRRS